MPTIEGMNAVWQSEFEHGIRHDEYSVRGSFNNLLSFPDKFTGKRIGTIEVDTETKELIIKPFKEQGDDAQ